MAKEAKTPEPTNALAEWGKQTSVKYAKLAGKVDYDHEAAEQLAEALNEIDNLKLRQAQLEQLVKENEELHQFVWRTMNGGTVAIHTVDDEHLSNIMMHLLRHGNPIPRSIRGEAIARGLVVPATVDIDWPRLDNKTENDEEWIEARNATARLLRKNDRRDIA